MIRQSGADMITGISPDGLRRAYYPANPSLTQRDLSAVLSAPDQVTFAGQLSAFGVESALATFAYPEPGVAAVLFSLMDEPTTLGPRARHCFERVAGHLESVLRLRTRPELAVAAVLAPDGALLDLAPESTRAEANPGWASQVVAIERSRLRARRRDPEAMDDWSALTAAERDVLELLCRGLSNAEIARLRNRSRHTVANQVSAILLKTGHASRRSLVSHPPGRATGTPPALAAQRR